MRPRTRVFVVLLCILAAVLVGVCVPKVTAQAGCPTTAYSQFIRVDTGAVEIDGVTVAEMAAVDDYLRGVYGDDERNHVLAYFSSSAEVDYLLMRDRANDWSGYSGLTLSRVKWSWDTCSMHLDGGERVDLALTRTGFRADVQFGLFVHELSHANGTPDGDAPNEASWWERIGGNAYNGTCGYLAADAAAHCSALQAILATE